MNRWLKDIEVLFLKEHQNSRAPVGTIVVSGLLELAPALPVPSSTTAASTGSFPLSSSGSGNQSLQERRVVGLWNVQAQRFDSVTIPHLPAAASRDGSPKKHQNASAKETENDTATSSSSSPAWFDQLPAETRKRFPFISSSFKACCIYGVVETGLSSVLVLVTRVEQCPGIKFPSTGLPQKSSGIAINHKVFKIEEVQVISLPTASASKSPSTGPTDRLESERNSTNTTSPDASTQTSGAGNTLAKSVKAQEKAAAMYVDLIKKFFSGGSSQINMYLSFSMDLTLPMEKALPNTAPPSLSGALGSLRHSASIQSVDQWGFAKDSEVSGPAASPAVVVDPTTLPSRNEFRWNAHLISAFAIDLHVLCPPVIRGYVGATRCMNHFCTSPSVPQPEINVALIARQSAMNAGTRYNRRGINGDGVPGNFTETEQVVFTVTAETDECVGLISSIRAVRGSVPVQWKQPPDFDLKPTPRIRSSLPPVSTSSKGTGKQAEQHDRDLQSVETSSKGHGYHQNRTGLEKELGSHIEFISQLYPEMAEVYCLDLMDTRHPKEGPLCEAYSAAVQGCMGPQDGNNDKSDEEEQQNVTVDSTYPSNWTYNAFNLGKELHRCAKNKRSIWGSFGEVLPKNPEAYRPSVMEIVPKLNGISSGSPTHSLATPTLSTPNKSRAAIVVPEQNGIALSPQEEKRQKFLLRVNCLDCLDRTNVTQFAYGTEMLKRQISEQIIWAHNQHKDHEVSKASVLSATPTGKGGLASNVKDEIELGMMKKVMIDNLSSDYKQLWVGHGNAISTNYAGSDALLRDVIETGQRTGKGKLKDGRKAISRYIQQHFLDGGKQDAVLLVTGKHDPSSISTTNPLERRMGALNLVVPGGAVLGWVGLLVSAFITFTWTDSPRWWMACLMMYLWLIHAAVTSVLFRRDAQSYIDMPLLPSIEPKEVSLKPDED